MDTIAAAVGPEKFADRGGRGAQRSESRTWLSLRRMFDPRLAGRRHPYFGGADGDKRTPIPPQFWPQY